MDLWSQNIGSVLMFSPFLCVMHCINLRWIPLFPQEAEHVEGSHSSWYHLRHLKTFTTTNCECISSQPICQGAGLRVACSFSRIVFLLATESFSICACISFEASKDLVLVTLNNIISFLFKLLTYMVNPNHIIKFNVI